MLAGVGDWMRLNGEAIYGSCAWKILGEGREENGRLRKIPGGKLGKSQADFQYAPQDIRFMVGKDGAIYAFCMTVPAPGMELKIISLGANSKYSARPVKSVKLLGHAGA